MSNQTNNRKKSNFTGSTTLPAATYLDFVSNGVNYKIDLASFQSALGVTGTLVQAGSTTATPVLETSGSVNKIRNIENGPGIQASISPQNGIKLSHNIVDGVGDVSLFQSLTSTQLVAKKLSSGTGITLSDLGNEIQINSTTVAVSSKTVTVYDINDFPAAVAGVITLSDGIDYLIVNDITTSNRFVSTGTNSLRSVSSRIVTLTYTGTGNMLTLTGSIFKIQNMSISTPSGAVCSINGSGTGTFQCVEVNFIACDTFGTISNNLITRFHSVAFENIVTGGMTFTGAHANLVVDTAIAFLNGGTFINLGNATFTEIGIENAVLQTSAGGTTFLSGAASSANLAANSLGRVTNCSINGSATPLSGITVDDAQWQFHGNDEIQDTRADALLSMQGNATTTVITIAGTPVLVAGTWTINEVSQMAGTTGGRATYNGIRNIKMPVTASVTAAPATGGTVSLSAYIAINGTVETGSKRTATASSSSAASITIPWQATLSSGDYVEVFVANEDTTVDVLVSSAILRVD